MIMQSFTRRLLSSFQPKRSSVFKRLCGEDLKHFDNILPQQGSILHKSRGVSSDELEPFNRDWMGKYRGGSELVLRPRSTQQVVDILRYCNDNRLAVIPQGGNTGLVGGGVPVHDEVILNMSHLNKILHFDQHSGILVCDAGCVLETLDNYLSERGFIMPLDLGAKGSCQIGGNIATNAGGLRLLRYGSLHGSVLGLEVVLADGTVLNDIKLLRKDNTGYDLKQLFIGSEGTLGIITKCAILAAPKPRSVNVALLAVESFDQVLSVFSRAKSQLSEIVSAFEFFDSNSLDLVLAHWQSSVRFPLEKRYPFYVLLETSGSDKDHDTEKLECFLEKLFEEQRISDGVLAQDFTQMRSMWSIREGIPEACSKSGSVYKYDISLPLPVLYRLVEEMRIRLSDSGLLQKTGDGLVKSVVGFGHVGDGNLHLNIVAREYSEKVLHTIEPFVYEWTQRYQGSVSAEHGLGLMKKNFLTYSKSSEMIATMRKIKKLFDPNDILNPYKFFPDEGVISTTQSP